MAFHKPARQIEVFDISLMAVVTKAMGAFLVLTVLLLPYYKSSPDTDATSAQAHQELEQARQQMQQMARQLAEHPDDAKAMGQALQSAQNALDAATKQVDDLAKQAGALNSQLERARKEAEDAQAEAAAAKAAKVQTQVAEAEMEALANQALQGKRAAQSEAAEMEQQANQAEQAHRASQQAQADSDIDATRLADALAIAALPPKTLVLVSWSPDTACASTPVYVSVRRKTNPTIPAALNGTSFPTLMNGLLDRSGRVNLDLEVSAATADQPARRLEMITEMDDGWRAYVYAASDKPVATGCHITATVQITNLITNKYYTKQLNGVALSASGEATVLAVVSDADADHFPAVTADDLAVFKRGVQPATAPPPAQH
jgi:DNA polymerase III alpha subunit (gram-positive type)